ncbi:hypothetical protein ACI2KO_07795 [Pseudomonas piscis]|uniref:hypothetical protein n=1 Tax=Pseudomonas piscis TaxID=2614538 RepID=UPI0038504593
MIRPTPTRKFDRHVPGYRHIGAGSPTPDQKLDTHGLPEQKRLTPPGPGSFSQKGSLAARLDHPGHEGKYRAAARDCRTFPIKIGNSLNSMAFFQVIARHRRHQTTSSGKNTVKKRGIPN